jgi:single stranded DNA-binding protein
MRVWVKKVDATFSGFKTLSEDTDMMNVVAIIGNLGQNPRIGDSNETSWAHLNVAVNETWTDDSGNRKERVAWVRVVAFNGLARSLGKLAKGDQVAVSGRLQNNSFDVDGTSVTTLEVVADRIDFLRVKAWGQRGEGARTVADAPPEDEIPF